MRRLVRLAMEPALKGLVNPRPHLEELLKASPDDGALEDLLAGCEEDVGKFDRAKTYYERAVKHAWQAGPQVEFVPVGPLQMENQQALIEARQSPGLGIRFQIAHLKCPSCANPGSPMPPFGSLGMKRLRELAIFLEASKGRR